jgi:steroid 5-alpha reductase family enzyme
VSAPLLASEALAALCILFALVYLLARAIENYGIVDIAWSYSFALLASFYALVGPGWPVRRAMIAAIVTLWSLRLGTHLLVRIARKHPQEYGRYLQLRKDWGPAFRLRMAGFFQMQALSVVLLAIPFLSACSNPEPSLGRLEWAGAALWLVAIRALEVQQAPELLLRVAYLGLVFPLRMRLALGMGRDHQPGMHPLPAPARNWYTGDRGAVGPLQG